ncbi:class I SAM-dependent methyltransferase [Bacillus sp. T33-2]|uniref:class I SAM-dependent methyltransferase n=1 Tax=Bacillus sp. T33-2 TaxID=2054168 RepID=UPI000C77DF29|nr:class I SAM-dependent methyltransferase [Bacillus sp. T33-2]PLR94474.1 SAM-dependent methyltransferase [Bacillus sp. T33-2]
MGKLFPSIYDFAMKPLEGRKFNKIREELLGYARGRVLEIGSGTGINFPFYQGVEQVDAVEPNLSMIEKSKDRRKQASVPIHIHVRSAEKLNFDDQTFDTVVSTLVFCTIPDPVKALKEIKRVSKPQASILFFEHVKMEQPFLAKTQELLTPLWKKVCDGCHLNRNTLQTIKEAGFQVKTVKPYYKGLFLVVECTKDV